MRVTHAGNVFLTNEEPYLLRADLPRLSDSLAVTPNALGGLTLVEAVLATELPFIGGRMLAATCFLGKALVECAGVAVIAIFLRSRLTDTVFAGVVVGAFTAILAPRRIE